MFEGQPFSVTQSWLCGFSSVQRKSLEQPGKKLQISCEEAGALLCGPFSHTLTLGTRLHTDGVWVH